jgi:phosphate starvation-inducible protein PhoH
MAKRKKATTQVQQTRRPKLQALPGLEDHAIKPLEDAAELYAEIRDQRMELTQREHELKINALKLMHQYKKTIYRHNGVEITLVHGEDDVRVRVKKAGNDDEVQGED